MQSDALPHNHSGPSHDHPHSHSRPHPHGDTSPLPPSSPNLTTFHRPAPEEPSLRRRISHPQRRTSSDSVNGDDTSVRISIATPYSESSGGGSRRKEVPLPVNTTISELKDEIARGSWVEAERWYRDGMRLVWQGRIVRDTESIGDVVGMMRDPTMVHTFHLVARRMDGLSSSSLRPPLPTVTAPPSVVPPEPSLPVAPAPHSRNCQALSDTVHYVLFMTRHHLCHLLNVSPLEWEEMVPAPVVDRMTARTAVMSVVGPFADERSSREEGWEDWEGVFAEDLEQMWDVAGREGMERDIKVSWAGRVGRSWKEGVDGESASVELDGIPYQLHLPPLNLMTPTQLIHLLLYLRLTSLLPLLNNVLAINSIPAPNPTPTTNPIAPLQVPEVRRAGFRLQISAATVGHIFFAGVRVVALLWMLTREMRWDDFRLWIIGGGAFGWWAGDAMRRLRPGFIWNPRQAAQNPGQAANGPVPPGLHVGPNAQGQGIPANVAADAPFHAPAAAARMMGTNRNSNIMNRLIPLLHLNTDAEYLHLTPRRRFERPLRIVTQALLPVALWFITLIPEWESMRGRAIRRRERAIRVIVGELTTAARANDQEAQDGQAERDGPGEGDHDERPNVLPPGLDAWARKYYERVLERGEGIDWEEEREAQRAMGMADEDDAQGEGMRLRML